MSAAPLPKIIEPLKLVEQRAELLGEITISQLPRLHALLLESIGSAQVEIAFDKDEEGIPVLTGNISASVKVECQRCLEPMELDLAATLNLGIVRSDERAATLPKYYDPLILEELELSLWDLVEEELLLSLPLVATHPEDVCKVDGKYREKADDRQHPFAALQKLKN